MLILGKVCHDLGSNHQVSWLISGSVFWIQKKIACIFNLLPGSPGGRVAFGRNFLFLARYATLWARIIRYHGLYQVVCVLDTLSFLWRLVHKQQRSQQQSLLRTQPQNNGWKMAASRLTFKLCLRKYDLSRFLRQETMNEMGSNWPIETINNNSWGKGSCGKSMKSCCNFDYSLYCGVINDSFALCHKIGLIIIWEFFPDI